MIIATYVMPTYLSWTVLAPAAESPLFTKPPISSSTGFKLASPAEGQAKSTSVGFGGFGSVAPNVTLTKPPTVSAANTEKNEVTSGKSCEISFDGDNGGFHWS